MSGSKPIHGMRNTPTYASWNNMKGRCYRPREANYPLYGGRGIKVCARWHVFANFLEDMGPAPAGLTIDRIDGDGDYEPSNCRWATPSEQARNRSTNLVLEFDGRRMCATAWADAMGYPKGLIIVRLRRGWSVQRAITEAPRRAGGAA